jgi:hypothetical protein
MPQESDSVISVRDEYQSATTASCAGPRLVEDKLSVALSFFIEADNNTYANVGIPLQATFHISPRTTERATTTS